MFIVRLRRLGLGYHVGFYFVGCVGLLYADDTILRPCLALSLC